MKNIESIKTNMSAKDYDISSPDNEVCGFYEWNKPKFFLNQNDTSQFSHFQKVKENTGIYPDELWTLDLSICLFILPRLKAFRQVSDKNGFYPGRCKSPEDWIQILDKMIFSFEEHLNAKDENNTDKKYQDQVREGFNLFVEYFGSLWF